MYMHAHLKIQSENLDMLAYTCNDALELVRLCRKSVAYCVHVGVQKIQKSDNNLYTERFDIDVFACMFTNSKRKPRRA